MSHGVLGFFQRKQWETPEDSYSIKTQRAPSGAVYHVERQVDWDSEPGGALRIWIYVHDGSSAENPECVTDLVFPPGSKAQIREAESTEGSVVEALRILHEELKEQSSKTYTEIRAKAPSLVRKRRFYLFGGELYAKPESAAVSRVQRDSTGNVYRVSTFVNWLDGYGGALSVLIVVVTGGIVETELLTKYPPSHSS